MQFLSNFNTEFLRSASLDQFSYRLRSQVSEGLYRKQFNDAQILLQQEIYPKLGYLAGMVSEPLVLNYVDRFGVAVLNQELQYYRFTQTESLLLIGFQSPTELAFLFGERQFDDSICAEVYIFDTDHRIIAVQNHHFKGFEVIDDFGNYKVLNSTKGRYLFSSHVEFSQCQTFQSKYIHQPMTTSVELVRNNPFKETMK